MAMQRFRCATNALSACVLLFAVFRRTVAFRVLQPFRTPCRQRVDGSRSLVPLCLSSEPSDGSDGHEPDKTVVGDPVRAATGIRASLHPTTINAIVDVLKNRAADKDSVFRSSNTAEPIDVVLAASNIATGSILKRQESSVKDDMLMSRDEEQAVAGRVVGVAVRLKQMEQLLYSKVENVDWIDKFDEWPAFGVLKNEKDLDESDVNQRVKDDPLFAMTRAECLLACFIDSVEVPSVLKANTTLPDQSKIDFLDDDRTKVLLGASDTS